MSLETLRQIAAKAQETQAVDMTETTKGGTAVILPAGTYNAVMIDYIEMGKQVQLYQGKPNGKPPALTARIGFEVYGDDGEVAHILAMPMTIASNNEKATCKRIFDRMHAAYPDITHLGLALGRQFRLEITVDESKGKKYNNINWDSITRPANFNPETGKPYVIPALDESKVRGFFWDYPTVETWKGLFIDGKRDDGKSKNFIQEEIISKAVDFACSPLFTLLSTEKLPMDIVPVNEEPPVADTGAEQTAPVPAAPPAPIAPVPAAPVAPPVAPTAPIPPQADDAPFDGGVPAQQ